MEQEREIARSGRPRLATPGQEQMLIDSAERLQRRIPELRRISNLRVSNRRTSQGRERHEREGPCRPLGGRHPARALLGHPTPESTRSTASTPRRASSSTTPAYHRPRSALGPSSEERTGDPSESFDSSSTAPATTSPTS